MDNDNRGLENYSTLAQTGKEAERKAAKISEGLKDFLRGMHGVRY